MVTQDDVSSEACPRCEVLGGCDCNLPTIVPLADPALGPIEFPPPLSVEKHLSTLFGRDSIYVILWALQAFIAAAVTPVATRIMGSNAFGEAIAAVAVMQLLICIATLSVGAAIERAYFQDDGPAKARKLVTLSIVLAVFFTVLADRTGRFWAPSLGFHAYGGAVQIAVIWAGVSSVTAGILGLLKAQDRLVVFALGSLTQSVGAQGISIGLVLWLGRTADHFILGQLLAQIAAMILVLAFVRPRIFFRGDSPVISWALRFSVPLVPAGLAGLALYSADRLILQAQRGESDVARYQIAYNIGSIPLLLLMMINSVWMPRFFGLANGSNLNVLLAAARDALYRMMIPVIFGVLCGGALVLKVWVPASYQPDRLQVLMFVIIMTSLPFAAGQSAQRVLMTIGSTKTVALATVLAAGVNIGLCFPLIDAWGLIGAGFATFISYVVQQVLLNLAARRHIQIPRIGLQRVGELCLLALVGWGIALLPQNGPVLVARAVATVGAFAWFVFTVRNLARAKPEPDAELA